MESASKKSQAGSASDHEKLCAMLRGSQFFGDFPEPEIAMLAKYVQAKSVDSGATIFREGDRGGFMCLLISGAAELFKQDRSYGSKRIAQIDAGKTVGEMALVDGEPRSATCICSQPSIWLMLTREHFVRIIRESPSLSVNILLKIVMLMSRRLRQTSGQLVDSLEDRDSSRVRT
jgi:CRP/FNR family cyclic AMP-dependent transcriptional regulator